MAKAKKPAAKSAAKPTAKKPVAKVVAKVAAKKAPAKAVKPVKIVKPAKVAKAVIKTAAKPVVKAAVVKPAKIAPKPVIKIAPKPVIKVEPKPVAVKEPEPKDQGELLIEKAKEEMASVNADAKQAEKASKVKPIKIERGNLTDEKAKWQELNKRYGKDKAQPYKMTDIFESMKPIQHKILGWGFVLTNENSRLEVLFENGIKMLISNYKPS